MIDETRWGRLRNGPLRRLPLRRSHPGSKSRIAKIEADSSDFGLDPASLVQYVLIARVDLLAERTYDPVLGWVPLDDDDPQWLDRGHLAKALGSLDKELSTRLGVEVVAGSQVMKGYAKLKDGLRVAKGWLASDYSARLAAKKDVGELEADLRLFAMSRRNAPAQVVNELGSVTTLWQELLGSGETAGVLNVNMAQWFHNLTDCGPQTSTEALVAGEALLSLLSTAQDRSDAVALIDAHRSQVTRTVRSLLAVATKPPGRGAMPAIHLLAELGTLPVQWLPNSQGADSTQAVPDLVLEHVARSPLGFHATRALTRMASLSGGKHGLLPAWWSEKGDEERSVIYQTLLDVDALRDRDPYPARSFWIEALRALRLAGEQDYGEKAVRHLEDRAKDPDRPVRERMYAAYCVYQALRNIDRARLNRLLNRLSRKTADDKDPDDGLVYACAFIRTLLSGELIEPSAEALLLDRSTHDAGTALSRFLSEQTATWLVDSYLYPMVSKRAERSVEINEFFGHLPHTIRESTRALIRYALLSIDGSGRRRAAEALRTAGVAKEAGYIVSQVLADSDTPRWLLEQAAFILGCLADPVGIDPLLAIAPRPDGHVVNDALATASVRHAATWALGDISEPDIESFKILLAMAEDDATEDIPVRIATTYALAALQPEPDASTAERVTGVLMSKLNDPEELVAGLAQWGLATRRRAIDRAAHRETDDLWGIAPLSPPLNATVTD